MARKLQLLRGTTNQNNNYTGSTGELTVDTEAKQLRLHDGETKGGFVVPKKDDLATVAFSGSYRDLSNIPSSPQLTLGVTEGYGNAIADIKVSGHKITLVKTPLNNYAHPTSSGNKHIPPGGSSGQILRWLLDGTAEWGDETFYSKASITSDGLMSKEDKDKLNNIDKEANKYVLPDASRIRKGGVIIGDHISVSDGEIYLTDWNITNALGYTPARRMIMTAGGPVELNNNLSAALMSIDDKLTLDSLSSGRHIISSCNLLSISNQKSYNRIWDDGFMEFFGVFWTTNAVSNYSIIFPYPFKAYNLYSFNWSADTGGGIYGYTSQIPSTANSPITGMKITFNTSKTLNPLYVYAAGMKDGSE